MHPVADHHRTVDSFHEVGGQLVRFAAPAVPLPSPSGPRPLAHRLARNSCSPCALTVRNTVTRLANMLRHHRNLHWSEYGVQARGPAGAASNDPRRLS
jgi:hypothetical protein